MRTDWPLWAALAVTAAVYGAMALGPLPVLTVGAGRLPDMRPFGYDAAGVTAYLSVIGSHGRDIYLTWQLPLDLLLPGLLCLSLILIWRRLAPRFAHVLIAVALMAAVADYIENAALWRVIGAGEMGWVPLASTMTGLKWAALSISFAAVVCMLAARVWRRA